MPEAERHEVGRPHRVPPNAAGGGGRRLLGARLLPLRHAHPGPDRRGQETSGIIPETEDALELRDRDLARPARAGPVRQHGARGAAGRRDMGGAPRSFGDRARHPRRRPAAGELPGGLRWTSPTSTVRWTISGGPHERAAANLLKLDQSSSRALLAAARLEGLSREAVGRSRRGVGRAVPVVRRAVRRRRRRHGGQGIGIVRHGRPSGAGRAARAGAVRRAARAGRAHGRA